MQKRFLENIPLIKKLLIKILLSRKSTDATSPKIVDVKHEKTDRLIKWWINFTLHVFVISKFLSSTISLSELCY